MKTFKFLLTTAFIGLAFYSQSYAQDINDAIKLYNDAATAFGERDFKSALTQAQAALEIASASEAEEAAAAKQNIENLIPKIYYGEARQMVADRKFDEALPALQKTIEIAGKYKDMETQESAEGLIPQVMGAYAQSLLAAQKFAEAIPVYEELLKLTPNDAVAYLNIGQAQARLNKEEEAIAAYEKASQLGSKDAEKLMVNVYLRKAIADQTAKKWSDVYANAEKAISYDADNVNGNKLLGAAAIELKRWDAAIAAYEKVLPSETNPDNTNYALARAYEAKGNKAKACESYKKITANPNFKAYAEAKVKELCN